MSPSLSFLNFLILCKLSTYRSPLLCVLYSLVVLIITDFFFSYYVWSCRIHWLPVDLLNYQMWVVFISNPDMISLHLQAHKDPSFLFFFSFFQDIPNYLEHCKFLPKLNNERPDARNSTYKERFSSLKNLVLIMVSLAYGEACVNLWNCCFPYVVKDKTSYCLLLSNSLRMTLFWSQRKRPGSDTTRTESLNPFYPHSRYLLTKWMFRFHNILEIAQAYFLDGEPIVF